MASSIKLKNDLGTEMVITHKDGLPAREVHGSDIVIAVDTIDDMKALANPYDGMPVFVRDMDRGGNFIYDSSKVDEDNDGTNFIGYVRQYSGTVSVKWFGAVGDGTADDTEVIQKAINFISASSSSTYGGTLYFPSSYYTISSTLVSANHLSILGDNQLDTYIQGDFAGYLIDTRTASKKFSARNITFKQESGSLSNGLYIMPWHGQVATISDCRFYNMEIAVNSTGNIGGTFKDIFFDGVTVKGISLDAGSTEWVTATEFYNIYFLGGGPSSIAFDLNRVINVKLEHCTIESSGTAIKATGTVQATNCWFESNQYDYDMIDANKTETDCVHINTANSDIFSYTVGIPVETRGHRKTLSNGMNMTKLETDRIVFPSTPVPNSNSNTLDFYKEGLFAPTVSGSSTAGTASYFAKVGSYTQIGNRVFFSINLNWSDHDGDGDFVISDLPIAPNGNTQENVAISVFSYNIAIDADYILEARLNAGNPSIELKQRHTDGSSKSVPLSDSGVLVLSGNYRASGF